jgi:Tannase and feruloyl esterase
MVMQLRTTFVRACFALLGLQLLPLAGVAGAGTSGAAKDSPIPISERSQCSALAARPIDDAQVISAGAQPSTQGLPEHCRVLAVARPAITIEVWMPTQNWNGKLYFAGCGGVCGRLLTEEPSGPLGDPPVWQALRRGYAIVTTDTGHWGVHAADFRWAMNNPVGIEDFAARGVHRALVVAKDLVAAYYGGEIKRSYFEGCSNGGRQGLIEAQRYPEDFDGIISGAPAPDLVGQLAAWIFDAKSDSDSQGRPILSGAKIESVRKAVIKSCGDQEGVVEDPRACRFDPGVMECKADRDDKCLTPQEIAVVRSWHRGPDSWPDKVNYGGLPVGSEASWAMTVGPEGMVSTLGQGIVQYLLVPAPGPEFDMLKNEMAPLRPRLEALSSQVGSSSVDISKFRDRGGKLLVWHGWADAAITPARTIDYFTSVQRAMGGEQATGTFARLFMIPGMNHCGFVGDASPGIDVRGLDMLSELEKWSEGNVGPERIVTTKIDLAGKAVWSRPICSYPKIAKYAGHGARNDASAWHCEDAPQTAAQAH